jgi:hypothetical protein
VGPLKARLLLSSPPFKLIGILANRCNVCRIAKAISQCSEPLGNFCRSRVRQVIHNRQSARGGLHLALTSINYRSLGSIVTPSIVRLVDTAALEFLV